MSAMKSLLDDMTAGLRCSGCGGPTVPDVDMSDPAGEWFGWCERCALGTFPSETRFVCKVCGAESPTGIGYAATVAGPLPEPAAGCPNLHTGGI